MNRSSRVRLLNFFRNIFRLPFLEPFLAALTRGKPPGHLICKLVPNPYQYSEGTFRVVRQNGTAFCVDISDYIGHYIYFGFQDLGVDKLFSLCKEDFCVLDIGTNIGWTALNFARIAKDGRVMGFEPDPYNFDRCASNIALNNFKNIIVFPIGLGNENRQMEMEIRTPTNRGGNRIYRNSRNESRMVEVERLDDFAPLKECERIDLIKIDVEGYELNVLRGAIHTLKKYKPVLFIELDDNNLKDQGDSAAALIEFLLKNGYREIHHAETGVTLVGVTDFDDCHYDIVAR